MSSEDHPKYLDEVNTCKCSLFKHSFPLLSKFLDSSLPYKCEFVTPKLNAYNCLLIQFNSSPHERLRIVLLQKKRKKQFKN